MALNGKLWRRVAAIVAIMIGALFMWLSPEQPVGAIMLMAGIALEVLGIRLDHA